MDARNSEAGHSLGTNQAVTFSVASSTWLCTSCRGGESLEEYLEMMMSITGGGESLEVTKEDRKATRSEGMGREEL